MDTKYSLTTLLSDLLRLQNNGYQIITKLSDVVSSNAETVEIPIDDGTSIQSVSVPSFGSIKNQLVRLENNIKSLSGIGDVDSSIQLSDGTFRKILISRLQREAEDIKNLTIPTEFATKENWFFESFLNPLLFVKFNLTNQVKFNTENVEVCRYILNIDSETKRRVFEDNFQDREDIQYQRFVKVLLDNNITYFLDKEIKQLEPRSLRFYGGFSVTKITDDTETETVDNVNYQKRVLRVKLDKLNYNDSTSEFLGTVSLKIGDFLVVNNERKNTRYEVVSIQSQERTVSLRLIEGFDPITIGTDILSYYSPDDGNVSLDVNIGFNEFCVIFIKPIDPDSKISSVNKSPGVAIYTNDLTTTGIDGESISLSQFYQNEVIDFGSFIYAMAKDGVIPSTLGLEPDAPLLLTDDFKVVQINRHLTDSSALSDLKKLQSDKLRVQSNLNTLNKSIQELRSKIQTTRYSSKQLQETDRSELSRLVEEKTSQSNLYESIIDDINKIGVDNSVENLTPKYRIRGFFPMPLPKQSNRTAPQEVVQFIIQYRYLSKDGSANQPEQIQFTDVDGQPRRGTFSTWVEESSEVRKRITDPNTGNTTWVTENVEDGDVVNINSIDIAISFGEAVEFRIKSLSESGWPITPKESSYSEIIRVEFPSELESTPDIKSILEESKTEKVRIELQNEINFLGIPKHLANSIEQGDTYYAHPSREISSGFLTDEQNMVSLFEKLTNMDLEILRLRALLESTRGILSVRVIDEEGIEYEVQANNTLKLFAGNYRDEVASLQVQKGVIVTKNYFVKISNESASNLELYARFFGSRRSKAQTSVSTLPGFNSSDSDYNVTRRYDFVPIGLSNADSTDISNFGFIRNFPESSSQVLGQFIQSRYKSIDGTRDLYNPIGATGLLNQSNTPVTSLDDLEHKLIPGIQDAMTAVSSGNPLADFIWKGGTSSDVISSTDNAVNLAYSLNSILVHIDHPSISDWITEPTPAAANIAASLDIRNSIFANLQSNQSGGLIQNGLFFEGVGATSDRYNKIGFEPDDQFLIGPRSVGAYLFLNPNSHSDLVVDGADSLSLRTVPFGDTSAITIPITFQYRMTDYFGLSDTGIGNVDGSRTSTPTTNLTYTKTMGIDIYANPINKEQFSFDIEITARYYSRTVISREVPLRTFESVLNDLNSTVKSITPRTSRDASPRRPRTGDSNRT